MKHLPEKVKPFIKANSDTDRSNEIAKKATLSESISKSLQDRLTDSENKLSAALDQLSECK